jgi:hypothetical protein
VRTHSSALLGYGKLKGRRGGYGYGRLDVCAGEEKLWDQKGKNNEGERAYSCEMTFTSIHVKVLSSLTNKATSCSKYSRMDFRAGREQRPFRPRLSSREIDCFL